MPCAIRQYARLLSRPLRIWFPAFFLPLVAESGVACPPTPQKEAILRLLQNQDHVSRQCLEVLIQRATNRLEREFAAAALRAWEQVFREDRPPIRWASAEDAVACIEARCVVRRWYFALVLLKVSREGEASHFRLLREAPPDDCYRACLERFVTGSWYCPAISGGRFVDWEGTLSFLVEGR